MKNLLVLLVLSVSLSATLSAQTNKCGCENLESVDSTVYPNPVLLISKPNSVEILDRIDTIFTFKTEGIHYSTDTDTMIEVNNFVVVITENYMNLISSTNNHRFELTDIALMYRADKVAYISAKTVDLGITITVSLQDNWVDLKSEHWQTVYYNKLP